jgi:hypothetical protein
LRIRHPPPIPRLFNPPTLKAPCILPCLLLPGLTAIPHPQPSMVVKLLTAAEKRGQQARAKAYEDAAALEAKQQAAQQEEARRKALEVGGTWTEAGQGGSDCCSWLYWGVELWSCWAGGLGLRMAL